MDIVDPRKIIDAIEGFFKENRMENYDDLVDVSCTDSSTHTNIRFTHQDPGHDFMISVPKKLVGRMAESLSDHIQKGGRHDS